MQSTFFFTKNIQTIKKDTLWIEPDHFRPHNKTEESLILKAAESFGHFLGKNAELKLNTKPYSPMTNLMKQLNTQVYPLNEYFDQY